MGAKRKSEAAESEAGEHSPRYELVAKHLGWPVPHLADLIMFLLGDDSFPMSSRLAETLASCARDNVDRSAMTDLLDELVRLHTASQQDEHDALVAHLLEA